MDNLAIYKRLNEALEKRDFQTAEALLHDDYQLLGVASKPIGKREFLQMVKAVKAGVPDLAFNYTSLKSQGEQVTGLQHITGTHTGTLDLSFLGIPAQPPTGIRVALPEERISATFRDGKLYREEDEVVPEGGLEGFLKQIGVAVPA